VAKSDFFKEKYLPDEIFESKAARTNVRFFVFFTFPPYFPMIVGTLNYPLFKLYW